MKLLLDTHLLLWTAAASHRLPAEALRLFEDPRTALHFSAVNIWEIAIKRGLGRSDFQIDPRIMRRGLLDHGYTELPITGEHALAIEFLLPIHKDPFDRLLIAQAIAEGITVLTCDPAVTRYPGPIRYLAP